MADRIIKPGEMLFRRLEPEDLIIASINESTRTIWHPITREVVDRMGDIVRIEGANLKEFQKKPGVLYGHDYRSMNPIPVIAENIGFKKDGDRLMAGTRFLPVNTPGMSQGLKDLINDNWLLQAKKLLGWSMGFMPDPEATEEIKEDGHFKGYDFKKWTLLEYSSVIIPANQGAINDAIKGGQISGAVKKYFDMAITIDGTPAKDAPEEIVLRPYPSEHSCRLENPDKYSKFRRGTRNHKGKEYSVIFGEPKDGGGWEEQAYRYDKDVWDADEAKNHCKAHGGTFEAASGKARDAVVVPPCADCAAKIEDIGEDGKKTDAPPIKIEPQEPAKADDIKQTQSNEGGTQVLEKITEKINKGEPLTAEETDALAKFRLALVPEKKADPVRKLGLVDSLPKSDVRPIHKFYGSSPDDEYGRAIADDPKTYRPAEIELLNFLDNAYVAGTVLRKRPDQLKMWQGFKDCNSALAKALAEATAGSGSEWVPTLLSANLYQMFFLASPVASMFQEVQMPGNPYTLPYSFDLDDGFYYVSESISDEPSKSPTSVVTSGLITLTARKFKRRVLFSDELNEDAIVPVLPSLRSQIILAGSRALENAIINGDVTATHQDSDVTDSKDIRKIWPGLRKLCPAGTKVDLGTFATATLATIRTAMSKWGMDPSSVAWIPGPKSYNKMLGLTEVLTNDKFGPQAVIQTGQLGGLLGVPIVPSEKIRENLNATGVYDGTTTTKTIMLIVNKNGFILGSRGTAKLTFDQEGAVDQNQLCVSFRKAFQYLYNPASYPTIGLAYNIA